LAFAADIGSAVSTDDICAVRPDLCGGAASRNKKRKKKVKPAAEMDFADFEKDTPPPKTAAANPEAPKEDEKNPVKKKKKRKVNGDPLADFWEREIDGIEDAPALDIERKPASVKPAAVAPAPPPRQRISFDSYLNANSGHSAVGGRYAGRQDAFQQAVRPASLTGPASAPAPADGGGAAPGQGDSAGNGQSVREPLAPAAAPAPPTGYPPPQ